MAASHLRLAEQVTKDPRVVTDVWNWRPDADSVVTASDVMTVIGGVARKD